MKVGIITDTHYGGKNDNLQFASFQRQFYEGTFFPILEREGVTTILHLGDVFDRRKYSNFNTLKLAKEMFFDPARDFKIHMLVGNHDAYFKNSNEVNSVTLTCAEYNNITVYQDIPDYLSQYRDRNLLVVDDVSDGGSTFDFVVDRIRQRTNYKVYTAAPYIKTGTKFVPDFYVTEFPKDEWIVFPFEAD